MPLGNVSLTPQLVQAVRDAADIVAVASDHTRLRKAGRRYQGLCPLHKEKTPSFSVDPVQGLFYCFGCGAGGDAIKLHMLASGDDFPAAIEALAQRYGIPLPARTVRAGGTPERDLEGALGAAARFFAAQLRQSAAAQRYLAGRRVSPELIERFGLGYAPDSFQALIDALTPRVSLADLEAAGLVGRSDSQRHYDRFRHRLMFPIHNQSGRLVGFGGRTLGDDKAKYINTAETERFHKGHLLYGLSQARQEIREERRAVLVEGYFDVIATVASGRTGTVAGMGTALTQEQARLLARYADEVVVAYDGDRAGEAAFERALPILLAEGLGVLRARFGEGHDPDSLRLASGEAAVAAAIDAAEDGVVLQLRAAIPAPMASARLKATQAGAVAALLEPIRDSLMRSEYARRAAEMLGVPEKEFLSRLKELKGWRGVAEAPSPGEGSAAAPGGGATGPHLVRSLEEQVLSNLLQAGAAEPLPALAELPSPAVFFDPECRNIYTGFRTLYAEGGAAAAGARAVLARVASQQATVDRMAQILLEGPFDLGRSGLSESLAQLLRRWRRQRLRELLSEIGAAQRQGDQARLTSLLEEKTSLSQSLHRGGHSGVAGGEDR
ncbi:MAG TPA: DNA primase [Thermoanaerobaculia bacterium]|jgi:DNA primase|nr:DNA primase [Thermoanaerobaculia bacterium]